MANQDKQYERKARYNPRRQTYVDDNGNYVYLIWDEATRKNYKEVCVVGNDGFSPELRTLLDDMDANEESQLDEDDRHMDKVFDGKKKVHCADKSGHTPDPMDLILQPRQCAVQETQREDPRVGQLLRAMEKLTSDQVDLIYAIYGEMRYGADLAREQGVSRQAVNNRLKKIQTRLAKLMAEQDEV